MARRRRRNPLDIGLSCWATSFREHIPWGYDQRELARFINALRGMMDRWRQVLPADRYIEVDYETVVADLEGEARRLVDFVGLAWDPACLEFSSATSSVGTASREAVRQPLDRTSVGRGDRYRPYIETLARSIDHAKPARILIQAGSSQAGIALCVKRHRSDANSHSKRRNPA